MSSYMQDARSTSKSRAKVVKPILRKFTQSETNSLDLDRSAADQEGLGIYDFGARSAHDVSFNHANRRGYHHRSTSGTSQFSTATSGSGQRTGSFVHPFQQTPRPYTPPLGASHSYQGSLREDEQTNYSPALTEEEGDSHRLHHRKTSGHPSVNGNNRIEPLARVSTSNSSLNTNPLRIQTKQYPSSASRLARESHTSLSSTLMLSPEFASPTETMSPVSGIRGSIDLGFRLRSRSDVHYNNVETIEEARRRWDLEQKQKEEKYAKEEIRKLEKQNKAQARDRIGGHRRSSASEGTRSKRSKSDLTIHQEKTGVFALDYTSAQTDLPPVIGAGLEEPKPSRTVSSSQDAKKKANSTFHAFLMWLRTRILRMKKKTS